MDAEILRDLMKCSLMEKEARLVVLEEEDLLEGVLECEESAYVKFMPLNWDLLVCKASIWLWQKNGTARKYWCQGF
ncbi:hypothetical protein LIER_36096 [Lithospermum erythrorhizon]|uniref:Uncharacterized protein n=1 Tax=Lithospermum erythrorhizon TaxID=34254 RepID=A0AAV3P0Q9_LITER